MKKILFVILIISVISPTLLSLVPNGFFPVHDNTQVERVFQMSKALSDGQFPVRWVADLGYGYGYPIFNFYAPLPYYLGGFIGLLISNSLLATKMMFLVGISISFFSMYLFASSLTSRLGGIVAGVIYLYFSYHAVNIYIRGAVGEFFAYAFLPLVFWVFYFLYKKINTSKDGKTFTLLSIVLSIPIALVVASHNLSAYMMGMFIVPYILYLFLKVKNKKIFAYSLIILFSASFLISAFYILPVLFESVYTDVKSQIGGGAFYSDHFVCIRQLFFSNWGFGGSAPGCIDGFSFALGRLNILALIASFAFFAFNLLKNKKFNSVTIFWVLLFISIFLTLSQSKFIWDNLPFMEYLQFPWRFLNFVGFFISIILAYFVHSIGYRKIQLVVAVALILGTIYFNYKLFMPVEFNDNLNEYYEDTGHIRWETSKISDEYMPSDFKKPGGEIDLAGKLIEAKDPGISLALINHRTGYIEFIKEGPSGKVHINKAYFPSWKSYSNDKMLELSSKSNGMSLSLPEGRQSVVVSIRSTLIQKIGNTLSLIGIILVVIVIITKRKKLYE